MLKQKDIEAKFAFIVIKSGLAVIKHYKEVYSEQNKFNSYLFVDFASYTHGASVTKQMVFKVPADCKNVLYAALYESISEIRGIDLVETDTEETIVEKLKKVNTQSILAKIISFYNYLKQFFGKDLQDYNDIEMFTDALFKKYLSDIAAKFPSVISRLAKNFENFLKCVGYIMGTYAWSAATPNCQHLMITLDINGFTPEMLTKLKAGIIVKPKAKTTASATLTQLPATVSIVANTGSIASDSLPSGASSTLFGTNSQHSSAQPMAAAPVEMPKSGSATMHDIVAALPAI
jgi:hypothetical protein